MAAPSVAESASEAQLKRKRSQKEKASASETTKRQKSNHADTIANRHTPAPAPTATPSSAKKNGITPTSTPKSEKKQKRKSLQGPPDVANTSISHTTQQNAQKVAKSERSADMNMQDGLQLLDKNGGKTRRGRRKNKGNAGQVDVTTSVQAVQPTIQPSSTWSISTPVGGRYIAHDPIFSSDERYLFASNGSEFRVLSLATSLVERSIPAADARITAFATSATDADEIYVASSGTVQRWDWISGTAVNDPLSYDGKVHALSVVASEEQEDVIYTLVQTGAEWHVMAGSRIIYTSKERLSHFQVKANYILAVSPGKLVVGRPTAQKSGSEESALYSFLEIKTSFDATCLDGRVSHVDAPKKKGKHVEELTVAVGNPEGAILIYEDVFSATRPDGVSLAPRTLHWHREPVSSVKWSRDGNYLISGGKETVLVMWQLATGKKQFLPHLTAEIEQVTISPSGSSYAIQLADNSIMALSTSELKPTANFAGLQTQSAPVMEKSTAHQADFDRVLPRSAAALHPTKKDQLIISVPPSASEVPQATSMISRPFLQTYDITADRHISRQALTRNQVTDFNKGPLGNRIRVPDVTHLQISQDGEWLATAEDWTPPSMDVAYLAATQKVTDEERLERREVYLKIWRRNADKDVWALESRIDSPHQNAVTLFQGRVLGLVHDPAELGFATIGEDRCLRIWKPKTRLRNGVVIRGSNDEGLVDWSCRHTVNLGRSFEMVEDEAQSSMMTRPTSAAIAYSEDGSMLAVAQAFDHTNAASVVHFIDTASGSVAQTRAGLFTGKVQALNFSSRYLIIVSDISVHVWDVVDEALQYSFNLTIDPKATSTILLTVSHEDSSFAISASTRTNSRVQIYTPSTSQPALVRDFAHPISALLAVDGRKGYTVLTAAAELYTLLPKGAQSAVSSIAQPSSAALVAADVSVSSEEAEDMDTEMEGTQSMLALEAADEDEADKPIVRPEQLARIFEADNVALMPVRDMFDAVIGLYARRPRTSAQAGAA